MRNDKPSYKMPSRRQIRESTIQFLYCSDLEGGADPAALREPFWEFLTDTDRRNLQIATFRTVHHLAHGREERLSDFVQRAQPALAHLTGLPKAEAIKDALNRLLALESSWSLAFLKLGKLPKTGEDSGVADEREEMSLEPAIIKVYAPLERSPLHTGPAVIEEEMRAVLVRRILSTARPMIMRHHVLQRDAVLLH